MKVYAVTYTCGYESGYKIFVGMYSTEEMAKSALNKDLKTNPIRFERNYKVTPITIDKAVNERYQEW